MNKEKTKNTEKTIYSELKQFAGYVEIGENSISIPIKHEKIECVRKFMLDLTMRSALSQSDNSCERTLAYLLQQISLILN